MEVITQMFIRILRKDFRNKKGITAIIFVFMVMATLFISVSINNICQVVNATEYSLKKGKIPDVYISAFEQKDGRNIEDWIKNNELVTDYSVHKSIFIVQNNIESINGQTQENIKSSETILCQSVWEDLMLLYDSEEKLADVKEGDIGICEKYMKKNNLNIGDTITLRVGDCVKTFNITKVLCDPALGSDFTSLSRFLFNEKDYKELESYSENISMNYGINTKNTTEFVRKYNRQGYDNMLIAEKDTFRTTYTLSLIVSVILVILGVLLIVISVLVLRFTIMFTIQEEYKEIGIMKAIGMKSFHIRMLYLIKYFVLISIASVLGCIISIPVSRKSMHMVVSGSNLLFRDERLSVILNILAAILTMLVVMLLCIMSTRKIKKFSAIEAVRSGTTGERYTRKSFIKLKNIKYINTAFFMALNDILSEIKKYIVLILTFAMGTSLIIISLNTITSMTSDEMAENFGLDLEADFYLSSDIFMNGDVSDFLKEGTAESILSNAEESINSTGYKCDVTTCIYLNVNYYKKGSQDMVSCMTMQPVGDEGKYINMAVGDTPLLENEMAMSAKMMRELDVNVGDTICAKMGKEEKEFVITGRYANYMQLGKSAFISSSANISQVTKAGTSYLNVTLLDLKDSQKEDAINDIKKKLPKLKLMSAQEVVAENLGSQMDNFINLKYLILLLVCGINVLITIMMVKIFLISERGQTAILTAIGFSIKQLKLYQMFRIGIILIISNVLGIVCSLFLNNFLLKPIFAIMGAEYMKIHINYREAYIIYPLILLAVTCFSAFISSGRIKKLKIMEINNIE